MHSVESGEEISACDKELAMADKNGNNYSDKDLKEMEKKINKFEPLKKYLKSKLLQVWNCPKNMSLFSLPEPDVFLFFFRLNSTRTLLLVASSSCVSSPAS